MKDTARLQQPRPSPFPLAFLAGGGTIGRLGSVSESVNPIRGFEQLLLRGQMARSASPHLCFRVSGVRVRELKVLANDTNCILHCLRMLLVHHRKRGGRGRSEWEGRWGAEGEGEERKK